MSEQSYSEPAPAGSDAAFEAADDLSAAQETPAAPAAPAVPHVEAPERTGVPRVDTVLETLERLDELPLEEHVGVFEAAHAELRRALDASPTQDAMARIASAGS